MMTDDEIIAVVAAHRDGKTIQFSRDGTTWTDMGEGPGWNFNCFTFRIKPPEPMKAELWFYRGEHQFTTIGATEKDRESYMKGGYFPKHFVEAIE